jgi:CubicO group peptidase (beta-lactamase class C family)
MKDIPVETLQKILDDYVDSGKECGLQLTIYQGGKLAADLCSGYTDASRTCKVTKDSLFPIFSSGKAVMATAFLMLWEEYGFSMQDKVSKYWPEFVGNGKENTEINHVISHRTGLHLLPGIQNISDQLADWEFMWKKLCAAKPKWAPGTTCGYQGITISWLLGELAYRISGIPFKKYIEDKIFIPLGIEDSFFFGTTDEAEKRIVDIDETDFNGTPTFTSDFHRKEILRKAFIPAANGIASARAAAKIMNALYHNENGPNLLKKETLDIATRLNRHPDDVIPPREWAKFGLGYALPNWERDNGDIFGHGGACGAEFLYCKSRDLALCFVKNRTLTAHPAHTIRDSISAALDLPERFW